MYFLFRVLCICLPSRPSSLGHTYFPLFLSFSLSFGSNRSENRREQRHRPSHAPSSNSLRLIHAIPPLYVCIVEGITHRHVTLLTAAPLSLLIKVSRNILQCALALSLLINPGERDHNYLLSRLADSPAGLSSCRFQVRPRGYLALVCWVQCLLSLLPPFILRSLSFLSCILF